MVDIAGGADGAIDEEACFALGTFIDVAALTVRDGAVVTGGAVLVETEVGFTSAALVVRTAAVAVVDVAAEAAG